MLQHLKLRLEEFHKLFQGKRCSGWELEELIVKSISSDTSVPYSVLWKENGHDMDADMTIIIPETQNILLQIKSGQTKNTKFIDINGEFISKERVVTLSGNRLGRFDENFSKITDYINTLKSQVLCVPCVISDDDLGGRQFEYNIKYLDPSCLASLNVDNWFQRGSYWEQINPWGVRATIRPTMSWQIWWDIPVGLFEGNHNILV